MYGLRDTHYIFFLVNFGGFECLYLVQYRPNKH